MPPEFRFDCKYCLKPIFAPYNLGGKKVRCPHCKNPVSVPMMEQKSQDQPTDQKAGKTEKPAGQVKRKNQDKRPVHSKNKFTLITFIKLAVLLGIIFLGYKAYPYIKPYFEKDKKFEDLMEDYREGRIIETYGITMKVSEKDFGTLQEYSSSSSEKMRELVAECLGKITTEKSAEILGKLLSDNDKNVRSMAAKSLGNVAKIRSIDSLIARLEVEKDDDVKGNIGRALRNLTEQNFTVKRPDEWINWWKSKRRDFRFPKYF